MHNMKTPTVQVPTQAWTEPGEDEREQLGSSAGARGRGDSVLFVPPGGSTRTPPDSNSHTASAHGAADGGRPPRRRRLPVLHNLSGGDLQSVSTFTPLLSLLTCLVFFLMHALIYTRIHIKPLIHLNIFWPRCLIYLYVMGLAKS